MKLYNTLSRKIEEFEPITPPEVKMYTCGMTVYDHTQIGNMRTYVNTDVLRRALEYNSYKVNQVENVTDVGHLFGDRDMGNDKLEVTAQESGESAWDIAKMYEEEFFEVMDALNVKKPTIVCRATEHIKEMIDLVKKIEANGFTYKTSDGIYFDTSKIKDYTKLSGMPIEKLREGARIEVNQEKRNPTDFALWKFTPKGVKRQMEWESPWAKKSYPGWHIECSAMGTKYLGDKIDIHTGGEDHISIHHTNERAQNIAATGHSVVNLWFHNVFLVIDGRKMSKSLKNFFWRKDIEERGFELLALRYLFLTGHYRSKMNFTWEALKGAAVSLNKLRELVASWREEKGRKTLTEEDERKIAQYKEEFLAAINQDLNIPQALAVVWQLAKSSVSSQEKLDLILDFDQVLGLRLSAQTKVKLTVPEEINKLVEEREELRKQGKWQEADEIRKEIEKAGFKIEDTEKGSKIKRFK